jgi:hypothetical protein
MIGLKSTTMGEFLITGDSADEQRCFVSFYNVYCAEDYDGNY